jgi:hypothetical protein
MTSYLVQLAFGPGRWQPFSGRLHATRAAAAAEIDEHFSRWGESSRGYRTRGNGAFYLDPIPASLRVRRASIDHQRRRPSVVITYVPSTATGLRKTKRG